MTEKILNLTEFEEGENPPISFTPGAIKALKDAIIKEELDPEMGLRVGCRGGGCSGLEYVMDFSGPKSFDFLIKLEGVKVFIDPVSAMHLEGTTIDYVTTLMEAGFKFINPNAKNTCGCGSSFS